MFSVATGDVNGDPFDDVIVGRWQGVDVYHGSATGPSESEDWTTFEAGLYFGSAVSAGDFNGDGYDDVVVNELYLDDTNWPGAGKVFVYHGLAEWPQRL